ncbi:MAG: S41 family peptidase, partial [Bacteroidota bacterium]
MLVGWLIPFCLFAQQPENLDFEAPGIWQPKRLLQKEFLADCPGGAGKCGMLSGPFTDYNSGYLHQDLPVKVSQAGRFTVTAMIKTEGVVGNGAQIYAYGKANGAMEGYRQSTSLKGDTDWKEVTFEMILDPSMDTLRLGCYLHGEGKAWFDDLTFEVYQPSQKTTSAVALAYLQEFFDTVRPAALYREKIDWGSLEKDARNLATGAQTKADTYSAIQYTLSRINKHSFFQSPTASAAMAGEDLPDDRPDPNLHYTTGRRINEEVAYLEMPAIGSRHQPTLESFADSLQGLIAALDTETTTGWVLDLRKNEGGNCWPMLAGVGPLLGEGICGHFQAPNGDNAQPWSYENGKSLQGESEIVGTRNYVLKNPKARIAVLTGPQTISSGEVTTTAFIGHPRARSFGQPTGGFATTNSDFELSDGATVYLTVSVYADRNKQPVGEKIIPDEVIAPRAGDDFILERAVK